MTRKKSLKERIADKYYRYLWGPWVRSGASKFIEKHTFSIFLNIVIILFVIFALFCIRYYLFLSPANAPEGEEYIYLSTTLEAGADVNVSCEDIIDDYKKGTIIIEIDFKKEEETDDKIYFDLDTIGRKLPSDWMEKSYMELWYSANNTISIPLEMTGELGRPKYYFDLNKSKDEEVNVTIYAHIGEDFFPTEREIVTYRRHISFPEHNCILEINSTEAHFFFSPDWKISYVLDNENNIIPSGGRNLTSKATDPNEMSYYMILDRNMDQIALNIAKNGILVSIAFAGFVLIINAILSSRK